MKKTHVTTDHGCQFRTGYRAIQMGGKTMDCRCGRLLIFPEETTVGSAVRARDFHTWMNEQDPRWPADGNSTYYAEFPGSS